MGCSWDMTVGLSRSRAVPREAAFEGKGNNRSIYKQFTTMEHLKETPFLPLVLLKEVWSIYVQ